MDFKNDIFVLIDCRSIYNSIVNVWRFITVQHMKGIHIIDAMI